MGLHQGTRNGLVTLIITVCGLAIAALPLALWVAPTLPVFKIVLAVGGTAFLIITALAILYPYD